MAKAKKGPRGIIALKSSESGNITHYTTRNKRNQQEKGKGKLELMKYDPKLRKHVLHKEVEKLK
ncbi:MAG TPA: 50S ribosomal protein L33 [Patescibacteria group bacterium]|nr:50S ribosomal protein L33 [Patescibacteria group bacterium]